MEIKDMKLEDIEQRLAEIAERRSGMAEVLEAEETEEAVLDELQTEAEALNQEETELEERKAAILEAAEQRQKELDEVMQNGKTVQEFDKGDFKTMSNAEVRASHEYNVAYANYIKTGDDKECRALLTETAEGEVPIASYVEDKIRTAWEKEGIMSRVKASYVKGNLSIGWEMSADDAYVHEEGSGAVTEEQLKLGKTTLIPKSIKKWISLSDEVQDLKGEAFLDYIAGEIVYRIAKKTANAIIADINACSTVSTEDHPAQAEITMEPGIGTVAQAIAELSDETTDVVVMMNKATWGKMKDKQANNKYAYDPFEGLPVLFNNTIKSYDAASTGDTWMIVGDLGLGAQANYPNGSDITMKYDDKTQMEYDMVRYLGRRFVGHGIVNPYAFTKVKK